VSRIWEFLLKQTAPELTLIQGVKLTVSWLPISEGKDAGKQLFYYDYSTGPGEPEATVVLAHGNPESS